jgi:IS605 OrfB family transposase
MSARWLATVMAVNLKEWAAATGVSYATARRRYESGTLPVPAYRLGRLIMVGVPLTGAVANVGRVVVYARVSSADQIPDLDRQVARAGGDGRRDAGRWHVAFTVEVDRAVRQPLRPGSVVGVDVGIKHLAVLSTGELIGNPRHLAAARSRMRVLGRALSRKCGPDRRTGRRASKRWERAAARLGRAHARVANLRRDGLHKLTTRLSREHGVVVVEDLNIAGMLANRNLARHVADAGFAEIRRQLAYKTRVRHRREWPGHSTWSRPEDPHPQAGGCEA